MTGTPPALPPDALPSATDPLALTRALVRCASVTPAEGGALTLLQSVLEPLGFVTHRLPFTDPDSPPVDNLYARRGTARPCICFAGHTDVVPAGDPDAWTHPPFAGAVADGFLWGRGAVDMKGAVAAFVAACARYLATCAVPPGSIALMITGDEEGQAVNGTRKILSWLAAREACPDYCLVGEPTNPDTMGQMVKIGRRGSLTGRLTVQGREGHTAYPHLADNPVHRLAAMIVALTAPPLDDGSAAFEPSTLQFSSCDVGNPASNVIPARAVAVFNLRFNDRHSAASVEAEIRRRLDAVGGRYDLSVRVSGEAFLTRPGPLTESLGRAVRQVLGRDPATGTAGGTSDARFIKDYCPVVEFGLVGATMHKTDERVAVQDLESLTQIYLAFLTDLFARPPAG